MYGYGPVGPGGPGAVAGDRHDAARGGFDDLAFYDLFATPRERWDTPVLAVRTQNPAAPFEAWLSSTQRREY